MGNRTLWAAAAPRCPRVLRGTCLVDLKHCPTGMMQAVTGIRPHLRTWGTSGSRVLVQRHFPCPASTPWICTASRASTVSAGSHLVPTTTRQDAAELALTNLGTWRSPRLGGAFLLDILDPIIRPSPRCQESYRSLRVWSAPHWRGVKGLRTSWSLF